MAARTRKFRRFCLLLALLTCLIPVAAQAQPAFQVKDINTTRTDETIPYNLAAMGGRVFFAGSDGVHGFELWRTDGTEAGTRMVADICPGACESAPKGFMAVGESVFFLAKDGLHGTELWKTDGTGSGTTLVKAVFPDNDYRWMQILAELNGMVLFSLGQELWRSDGTAEGTFLLADIEADYAYAYFEPVARLDGKFLFAAEDKEHGKEFWVTDGTASGTVLLKEIAPGTWSSVPGGLDRAVIGDRVLFTALGPEGHELWTSDGTGPGTLLVKDLTPGPGDSLIDEMITVGEEVFFRGPGGALWKSDGTAGGTLQVSPVTGFRLTAVGDRVFFFVDCSQLWMSDGTAAGTALVKNLRPGAAPDYGCWNPFPLSGGDSEFLFAFYDPVSGNEIWKSDGTAAGTALVVDLYPGASSSEPWGAVFADGRWLFAAKSGEEAGYQLWASDGTAAGTRMLRINRQKSGFALNALGELQGPRAFFDLNGTLLFQAGWAELWRSDGTAAGTSRVKDLWTPYYGSLPAEFTRAGSNVFFRAGAGSSSESLWKTDGTAEGTKMLRYSQYLHNFGSFGPRNLTALGDHVLFIGTWWGEFAQDLMRSDGTPAGTTRVTGDWGAPYSVDSIVSKGDMVLVQEYPNLLWKSDGTAPGTTFLGEVLSPNHSLEDVSALRDGVLYFAGSTPASGEELWRSDGTVAGTYLLAEIVPGPDSKPLRPFAVAGPTLFFAAGGHELWKNDGTATSLVRALPGDDSAGVRSLTALGEKVYFTYDDGVHGHELWVSDGTAAGTRMVEDILPGAGSSHPRNLHAEGSILVFSATDGVHGVEAWRSDGTVLGTRMLQDIAPSGLPSSPVEFTASGSNLYFAANDGTRGFELWALPRTALLATFADVPADYWAWASIEKLAAIGITKGCAPDRFCPELQVSRAETAVFLLRAIHGAAYVPPPGTGTRFTDVPASFWAVDWIERFATEGITSGCGVNLFCPLSSVSRAELAVFLLRSRHGGTYQPPAATGTRFTDVPASYWAAAWIEQLANEGITTGCAPNQFCPDRAVTRAEMAALMVKAFFPQAPPPAL